MHTYSGYEQKAKAALEERVRSMHMEDKIGEVLVPVERVQELGKGGQRKISSRKFFPGYIFVNMVLDDETWHVIKDTPKITGFVGHATDAARSAGVRSRRDQRSRWKRARSGPSPRCCSRWARRSRWSTARSRTSTARSRKCKPEKGKVRVLISIFGRATPVELDFVQVEKA